MGREMGWDVPKMRGSGVKEIYNGARWTKDLVSQGALRRALTRIADLTGDVAADIYWAYKILDRPFDNCKTFLCPCYAYSHDGIGVVVLGFPRVRRAASPQRQVIARRAVRRGEGQSEVAGVAASLMRPPWTRPALIPSSICACMPMLCTAAALFNLSV